MEPISSVHFYTRYDALATKRESLDAARASLPDKEVRIQELELSQETTQLFSDAVGSRIDFTA